MTALPLKPSCQPLRLNAAGLGAGRSPSRRSGVLHYPRVHQSQSRRDSCLLIWLLKKSIVRLEGSCIPCMPCKAHELQPCEKGKLRSQSRLAHVFKVNSQVTIQFAVHVQNFSRNPHHMQCCNHYDGLGIYILLYKSFLEFEAFASVAF